MRIRWLLSIRVAVLTGCLLICPFSPIQAKDRPNPKVAIIECYDIPGRPPLTYDLVCEIELVGITRKRQAKATIGAGSTALAMAISMDAMIKDSTGLQRQLNADGRSVTVTGWKDPKTGKFYPVKRIIFTSKTMPKGVMPKVTNPKLPAA